MSTAFNALREPRQGVLLHIDGSASDKGALGWLSVATRVSYNWLITRDGTVHKIVSKDSRAWHAGVCRPSSASFTYKDANSAFYGVSLAAGAKETATPAQVRSVVSLCRTLMALHNWHPAVEGWRIASHAAEAWPRGRKSDPEGTGPTPVLSTVAVRAAVARP